MTHKLARFINGVPRKAMLVGAVVAVVGLLGCASQPPPPAAAPSQSASETPAPAPATPELSVEVQTMALEACADTAYANCYETVVMWMATSPGKLVAICELTPPGGGITEIPSEEEAAEFCSGGGTIARSPVVAVLRLPA